MTDRVNIKSLYQLPMENLEGMELLPPAEIAKRFRGSDLVYDTSDHTLKRISAAAGDDTVLRETHIYREAETVALLRQADSNLDGFLDLTEANTLLKTQVGQSGASDEVLYPGKFLQGVEMLMANRYDPIARNIQKIDGEGASQPLITLLQTYNTGLLQDEVRHAHSVLPVNGLTKSATNVVLFLPSAVHNIFTDDQDDAPLMMGTALAQSDAESRHQRAETAIGNLKQVFVLGVAAGEEWALLGNLEEALPKLSSEDRDIIVDQLAGKKIDKILHTQDPEERFRLMSEFADGERPGFLGFGGGNTSDSSFWNYLGWRRNTYFSLSIQHYLVKKANAGDVDSDEFRRKQARDTIQDIKGEGGGFTNMFMVGLTNVLSVGGALFEPTPYREWGDWDEMNGVGRLANGVLALWGGHQMIKGAREAWAVRRVHGMNGLRQVWWQNARPWKPLPVKALGTAAATKNMGFELTQADRVFNGAAALIKWPFQKIFFPLTWMGAQIKKRLPLLSKSDDAASAAMTAQSGGKMGKLAHGILLLGIMQYADEKITGPVSPFEMGFEEREKRTLDANRPRQLQDFDPLAYPNGVPKIKPERL